VGFVYFVINALKRHARESKVIRSPSGELPVLVSSTATSEARVDMPTLITVTYEKKRYTLLRWGSHISIMWMLALLFIVPHDPSTRLSPWEIGSQAAAYTGWAAPRGSTAKDARGRAAITPSPLSRLSTAPQASASMWMHDASGTFRSLAPTMAWIARAAVSQPHKTARIVRRVTPELVSSLEARAASAEQKRHQLVAPWPMVTTLGVATTVEELRERYGRRQSWWGDLSPAEGRELYHSLLPFSLLNSSTPYTLGERARLAVAARRAARLYVRERTVLPATIGCKLLDGARTLLSQGAVQPSGLDEVQIFSKYAEAAGLVLDDLERSASSPSPPEAQAEVFLTILRKACSTNRHVDQLVGCISVPTEADALCDLVRAQ